MFLGSVTFCIRTMFTMFFLQPTIPDVRDYSFTRSATSPILYMRPTSHLMRKRPRVRPVNVRRHTQQPAGDLLATLATGQRPDRPTATTRNNQSNDQSATISTGSKRSKRQRTTPPESLLFPFGILTSPTPQTNIYRLKTRPSGRFSSIHSQAP